MKMKLSLSALMLILGGCAVQPISLNDRAARSYQVPIKTLVVDNLATESKIRVSDIVYVSGWVPAHTGFEPPLHQSFAEKMRNSIIANGISGRVDVSLLRAGFWVERSIPDSIAFIQIFVHFRERGFKCDADVNIKTENDSRRVILTHEVRRSYSNPEQARQFIESCQTDLIRQLADLIKKSV